MNIKYTKELLDNIVKDCTSIRQVILKLNLKEAGGNYDNIKNKIKQFNIDITHFGDDPQAWSRGKNKFTDNRIAWGTCKEKIFVKNSTISTCIVKKYLQQESTYVHICSICQNSEWLNKPIPLELDHINGDNKDNRKENLRFICPNCHTTTDTYRGKNINKGTKKVSDEELLDILKNSISIRQALIKSNLTPKGGNYSRIYRLVNKYNLDHLA